MIKRQTLVLSTYDVATAVTQHFLRSNYMWVGTTVNFYTRTPFGHKCNEVVSASYTMSQRHSYLQSLLKFQLQELHTNCSESELLKGMCTTAIHEMQVGSGEEE